MSWRTHGFYKGLSKSAKKWLRSFDRHWDTKEEGRSRDDAFDNMADRTSPTAIRPKTRRKLRLEELPAPEISDPIVEIEIALLGREVARFTVPKRTREGWSIHLVLKSGEKIRVPFDDEDLALQAYQALQEASLIKIAA